jgi:hypothetical protein
MSLSKRLASFHEAGHAVRAYYLRKSSLAAAVISLEAIGGGRWEGETGVNLNPADGIPAPRHIDIALAGLMAEALFNGRQHPAGDGCLLLDEQPELAATLAGYFGHEGEAEVEEQMEQTPVRVIRPDDLVVPVPAAINFVDLNHIPAVYRNVGAIGQALTRLATFFNDEEHWFRVGLLADDLDDTNWPTHYDYISFLRATWLRP